MTKTKLLVILLSLISCSVYSQGFSTKQGGHCYSMDIPDYLTKTYDLNDDASLQYQNVTKEAYVIVIDDYKDQLEALGMKFLSAQEFLDNFVNGYNTEAANRQLGEVSVFESNGNGHAQVELTWQEEEVQFYMLITAVESQGHFYKVMCWSLLENKDKLKNDFLAISKSIKD